MTVWGGNEGNLGKEGRELRKKGKREGEMGICLCGGEEIVLGKKVKRKKGRGRGVEGKGK